VWTAKHLETIVPKQKRVPKEYVDRRALSIAEFCRCYGISRGLLYLTLREGTGPRLMRVRGRVLISAEAAIEWRKRMEEEAA